MYLNNMIFNILLLGLISFELLSEAFNPFMDSDLHAIDWVGPIPSDFVGENVIVMKTAFNERYKCILPLSKDSEEERKKSYSGPTPDELMQSLFEQSSCSYRIESYWTYELCHGKHIRQYHENKELNVQKKPKVQEYYLGFARKNKKGDDTEETQEEEKQLTEIKVKRIDSIELPYFEVNMTDGTVCDLTKQPRQARVFYVCQPDGRGEIYEFKESSTCEYEIVVLTAVLCPNPLFKPKNPPVSKIACHSLEGSPVKPKILDRWSKEDKKHIPSEPVLVPDTSDMPEIDDTQNKGEGVSSESKPSNTVSKKVEDKTLGDITDKEVLRGFLSGSQCLSGGSGWWSHELCFNKKVRQYHEDQNGKIEIILGTWNKQKHLDWIKQSPSKRPKPKGQRTFISLLYSDGDVCDITGKKRIVEVKLRCVVNPDQPHSVSIYLVEPKTCEYTLGVESPLFCSILDRANDDGIIEDLSV